MRTGDWVFLGVDISVGDKTVVMFRTPNGIQCWIEGDLNVGFKVYGQGITEPRHFDTLHDAFNYAVKHIRTYLIHGGTTND